MQKGDLVKVVMTRNDIFPWQTSPRWDAVFLSRPQGPGDTFRLKVAVPTNKHTFSRVKEYIDREVTLNGNSSDFVGMYACPAEVDE